MKKLSIIFEVRTPSEFNVTIKEEKGSPNSFKQTENKPSQNALPRRRNNSEKTLIDFMRKRFIDVETEAKNMVEKGNSMKHLLVDYFRKRRLEYGKQNTVAVHDFRRTQVDLVQEQRRCKLANISNFLKQELNVKESLLYFQNLFKIHKSIATKFNSSWLRILLFFRLLSAVRRERNRVLLESKGLADNVRKVRLLMVFLRGKFSRVSSSARQEAFKPMLSIGSELTVKVAFGQATRQARVKIAEFLMVLDCKMRMNDSVQRFTKECAVIRRNSEILRKTLLKAFSRLSQNISQSR